MSSSSSCTSSIIPMFFCSSKISLYFVRTSGWPWSRWSRNLNLPCARPKSSRRSNSPVFHGHCTTYLPSRNWTSSSNWLSAIKSSSEGLRDEQRSSIDQNRSRSSRGSIGSLEKRRDWCSYLLDAGDDFPAQTKPTCESRRSRPSAKVMRSPRMNSW